MNLVRFPVFMTNVGMPKFYAVPEVINFMYKLRINSGDDRLVLRCVLQLLFVYDTY